MESIIEGIEGIVGDGRYRGLLRPDSTGAFLEDLFLSSEGTLVVRRASTVHNCLLAAPTAPRRHLDHI